MPQDHHIILVLTQILFSFSEEEILFSLFG